MKKSYSNKHTVEVADVILGCTEEQLKSISLVPVQIKALHDILACRTNALGGHLNICNQCGYTQQAYNSCHNRHCPKCQFLKQEVWIDKLKAKLLPVRHFHIVFSIPHDLNALVYANQKICYSILFEAASTALQNAAKNPAFLGADTGAVAVLHTWGQTLSYHPHIHMLVPAGGLSEDGMEWIASKKNFFVPARALSAMFRGIFIRLLEKKIKQGLLKLPQDFTGIDKLKKQLYQKIWKAHIKKSFRGANAVLAYLGRYTHRVAISNNRILSVVNRQVTFRYKNYRNNGQKDVITLSCYEFTRRFLMHILPIRFYKIRYYGIMASVNIKELLGQCRAIMGSEDYIPVFEGLSVIDIARILLGRDLITCPVCRQGHLISVSKQKPPS
jgi:hypothetical protein